MLNRSPVDEVPARDQLVTRPATPLPTPLEPDSPRARGDPDNPKPVPPTGQGDPEATNPAPTDLDRTV
jgi:hypothetical protein